MQTRFRGGWSCCGGPQACPHPPGQDMVCAGSLLLQQLLSCSLLSYGSMSLLSISFACNIALKISWISYPDARISCCKSRERGVPRPAWPTARLAAPLGALAFLWQISSMALTKAAGLFPGSVAGRKPITTTADLGAPQVSVPLGEVGCCGAGLSPC